MQSYRDSDHIRKTNGRYDLAVMTAIGSREEQQDSFGFLHGDDWMFIIVCDGMGGTNGGKLASSAAVRTALEIFREYQKPCDPIAFLQRMTESANEAVLRVQFGRGTGPKTNAGSTMVAVLIDSKDLYWNSVGDSRVYLLRKEEFVQMTQDQNYKAVLREQLRTGMISQEVYLSHKKREEALINYLGIGALKLIDYNEKPIRLLTEDKVLLTTDGLYKAVSESVILEVLENFSNIEDALQMLEMKAEKNAKRDRFAQDNTTAALLKILY